MLRALPLIALCTPVSALDFDLGCTGSDPDWTLSTQGDTARFEFGYDSELSLMLTTQAQGHDWPIAMTYIGRGDSVIAVIEPAACETGDIRATLLTQRGETPLMLVGCCTRQDR